MSTLTWFLTIPGAAVAAALVYFFKRRGWPVVGAMSKGKAAAIVFGVLFVLGGGLGSFLDLNMADSPTDGQTCTVSDVQLNGIAFSNAACTAQVSTTRDGVFEIRCLDANWSASDTIKLNATVVRSGSAACSIPLMVNVNTFNSQTDLTDVNVYSLVEKGTDGKFECYIDNTDGVAATSDAKEDTVLGFVEGDVSNQFSVICDDLLDEFDEINTYEHPGDLSVNVGSTVIPVEILKTG